MTKMQKEYEEALKRDRLAKIIKNTIVILITVGVEISLFLNGNAPLDCLILGLATFIMARPIGLCFEGVIRNSGGDE